jgi:tetratricopeptide (TPR) repeat protein
MAPQSAGAQFKIRLNSGRVLGPLDLERVRALILNAQISGQEQARAHPVGEWLPMAAHPELAELLLLHAMGKLEGHVLSTVASEQVPVDLAAKTQILESSEPAAGSAVQLKTGVSGIATPEGEGSGAPPEGAEDATVVFRPEHTPEGASEYLEEATRVAAAPSGLAQDATGLTRISAELDLPVKPASIANEKTVVFQRSGASAQLPGKFEAGQKGKKTGLLLALAAIALLADLLLDGPQNQPTPGRRPVKIRPVLPSAGTGKPDPAKSKESYQKGLGSYQLDTITGYRKAVEAFQQALKEDPENVRALAFLASAYLNLIDVSNKDENYFSVISKLIQLSRTKKMDLPETLIADSEYLVLTGRPMAAETRIVEYSKIQTAYNEVIKLYLAQALFARGELGQAARVLASLPPGAGMRAKSSYLRGRVAEGLGDLPAAIAEYQAALKESPEHAYSRFRMIKIADTKDELRAVRNHVEFLTSGADRLPGRELAEAYFLRSKLDQLDGKLDLALGHIERALGLEPENPDYNLNYFLLRAKAGDSLLEVRREARLYFYLAESERLLRESKVEEAQIQLMEARREAPSNPQPLVRLGNLFSLYKADISNARINFRKAAELAPSDVRIWSRYIELLIQSYEWEEANRALARLRTLSVPQGSLDKAMGDWYARQGRHTEAQEFYKKALSRETIDPSVYIAFGKSLLETRKYDQAPFMFALAQRFDPESTEAVVGTAKAIQGAEGIDRALSYLRDESQKGAATRPELICAMAELQIQKGAWDEAQVLIEQAKQLRPDMALPFKVEAQYFLAKPVPSKAGSDVAAKQKAAEAFKSYLDRSPSDAGIHYERYRVLVDLAEYQAADETLQRIYELYPKFPNLHYSKGLIYIRLANLKAAQAEFEQELKNGNNSLQVLLAIGGVHLEQRQHDKALGYFVQAMQRAPQEAEPKAQAAYANYLLKKYDAATALYREALKLDSGNPIIYRRLGEAYRAMGDSTNARWAFQKYLEMEPDASDREQLLGY